MLDIRLRPLKDNLFDPVTSVIPSFCSPLSITLVAFLCGLLACYFTASGNNVLGTTFWVFNRAFDCLDGAVARKRNQSSDLGGFLDLLGDFIVYSILPIACGLAKSEYSRPTNLWLSIAVLEGSFHVNNFVLFYIGAILEKRKRNTTTKDEGKVKELTSVVMRPALIEGTESAMFFTAMIAYPRYTQQLSWIMAALVVIGIVQRTKWLVDVLS
ncbi:hypothetical protein IQ06DRAFT_96079 [Phaeosphaeriaceae sp. SRC1lsM3a]|nr:hypothetical protein IQ06DRAFT_96079 [Stagonospora sp. SRC1lsM3a]